MVIFIKIPNSNPASAVLGSGLPGGPRRWWPFRPSKEWGEASRPSASRIETLVIDQAPRAFVWTVLGMPHPHEPGSKLLGEYTWVIQKLQKLLGSIYGVLTMADLRQAPL